MEAFCRFSWYIVGFKQRLDEIRGRNLGEEKYVQFWAEKKCRNKRSVLYIYYEKRENCGNRRNHIFRFRSYILIVELSSP